jgi:hypothetical protein
MTATPHSFRLDDPSAQDQMDIIHRLWIPAITGSDSKSVAGKRRQVSQEEFCTLPDEVAAAAHGLVQRVTDYVHAQNREWEPHAFSLLQQPEGSPRQPPHVDYLPGQMQGVLFLTPGEATHVFDTLPAGPAGLQEFLQEADLHDLGDLGEQVYDRRGLLVNADMAAEKLDAAEERAAKRHVEAGEARLMDGGMLHRGPSLPEPKPVTAPTLMAELMMRPKRKATKQVQVHAEATSKAVRIILFFAVRVPGPGKPYDPSSHTWIGHADVMAAMLAKSDHTRLKHIVCAAHAFHVFGNDFRLKLNDWLDRAKKAGAYPGYASGEAAGYAGEGSAESEEDGGGGQGGDAQEQWNRALSGVINGVRRMATFLSKSRSDVALPLEIELVNTWRHGMPHDPTLHEEAPGLLRWLRAPRVVRVGSQERRFASAGDRVVDTWRRACM